MKFEMYVAEVGYVGQVSSRREAAEIAKHCYYGADFVLVKL